MAGPSPFCGCRDLGGVAGVTGESAQLFGEQQSIA